MSTGCECAFIEVKPGEWFYLLEDFDAPKGAWDWREHATAYGPFATFDQAEQHLSDNHANPGGFSERPYVEGYEPDELMQRLISNARRPRAAHRNVRFPRFR